MTVIQIELTTDGISQVTASGFCDGSGQRDALRFIERITSAIDALDEAARTDPHRNRRQPLSAGVKEAHQFEK
jgi:hypothetical protein